MTQEHTGRRPDTGTHWLRMETLVPPSLYRQHSQAASLARIEFVSYLLQLLLSEMLFREAVVRTFSLLPSPSTYIVVFTMCVVYNDGFKSLMRTL